MEISFIFFSVIFCEIIVSVVSMPSLLSIQIDELQELQEDDVIDLSRLGDVLFSEPDVSVGKAVSDWSPEDDVNPEELGSYAEGDMLIPGVDGRNGLVQTSRRWDGAIVPYIFSNSLTSQDRNIIQSAINEYHKNTCVRFVPWNQEKDYISFENSPTGCWSSVGKVGRKQVINLQSGGCTSKIGTSIHEIMHALGFFHEQNRFDRDDYVRVLYQNIKSDTVPNFDKAEAGETQDFGIKYDTSSVMHYSSTAFSSNGGKTIVALKGDDPSMGQRDGFKISDISKINSMYGCDNFATSGPSPIKPSRPGGYTNPVASVVSGIGSFFQALGKYK